jgi:probable H4MPT-linked C1 transfer pathway protein
MNWLGLDIGGANLKAADGRGWARSMPFALWRDPVGLAGAIDLLIRSAPDADRLAVTMTGELCDCFRTKADGALHILAAVKTAAQSRPIFVYALDGRFVDMEEARELPYLVAASNWHALASFACRYVGGRAALLIDIGSTTTDIVPLFDGRPSTTARTDTERLLAGELVYTGVGRTPVCAVTRSLPWRGQLCPVVTEFFATTADAYVILGDLRENHGSSAWTADGRPLTKQYSRERLARMVCADTATFDEEDGLRAAKWVKEAQLGELRVAVKRVIVGMKECPRVGVMSGSGEFLASLAVDPTICERISLAAELGLKASEAAAAHAIAMLAAERCNTMA